MRTKRLLMGLVAMSAALTTVQAADYVYTNNARYKVMGANMFVQGSPEDGLAGWQNASGRTLDQMPDTFAIENEGGPDGGKYVRIVAGGDGAGIVNTDIMLEPGQTYYVTYKVKGTADRQSNSLSIGSNNAQNIFVNADGSLSTSAMGYAAVAQTGYYYNDTWTEMRYAYTVPADAPLFLIVSFGKLLEGDGFADFAVYPVLQVADDRVLQREIDRTKSLLAMPELTAGKDDLEGILSEMEEFAKTNESESEQNDYMQGLLQETATFLGKNGADVSPYFAHFTFDDVTPKGNSKVSGWETGGRWGTGSANNIFTTVFATQTIGNAYELDRSGMSQKQSLPAGKYLYVVSALAWDYPQKANVVDYRTNITGIKMFINNDSTEFDNLPTDAPKTYMKIVEVKEGESVNIGVYNTRTSNCNNVSFDNHYLYLLGSTPEEVEAFVNAKKLSDAQHSLKVMTDSAKVVVEKPEYIFGKQELRDSIALSDAVYAAQTDPIASPSILTQQMNYMRSAINDYHFKNNELIQFTGTIADCKALLTDEDYKEGKPALQAAVTEAEAFHATLDASMYTDSLSGVKVKEQITAADNKLLLARNSFYVANASYDNPGLVAIENPTFVNGPKSTGADVPGWDAGGYSQNSKSGWKGTGNGASYGYSTTGRGVCYGRNSSETAKKYLAQDVTLEHAGLYEFSSEMVVCHSNPSKNNVNSGVFFFVGKEGLGGEKFDSIQVCAQYEADGKTVDMQAKRWKVRYIATEPVTVRFGVDAIGNKTGNKIFFSANEVRYYGPYDKYQRDSVIAVAQPTVDSLANEIAIAQDLKNTSRNKEAAADGVKALETAIAHAEYVKSQEVTSLDALKGINDEITALKQAEEAYKISGVWPADGQYFDLTAYIKNAELADTLMDATSGEYVFRHWTSEGNTAYYGEDGLMTYIFNEGSDLKSMKIHQTVEGMPAGKYQFMANATYKLETPTDFSFPQDADMNGLIAKYNDCKNFHVVANNATVVMKGVLTGCEQDKWSEIISSWNYRHHHPAGILDSTRFENYVEFDLTAADNGKIDLGISATDAVATQLIWAKNFKLIFWGDKISTGIEETVTDEQSNADDGKIYNLQGVRVSTPKRGVYIKNGKKVVIK